MRFVGQGQELLNIFNSRSRHTVLYICVTNILLIPGFTDKSDLVHLGQGRTAAQQINRGQRRWPHSRSRQRRLRQRQSSRQAGQRRAGRQRRLEKAEHCVIQRKGRIIPWRTDNIFLSERRGRCGTFGQKIISGACFLAPELSNFTHTRVGRNICNTIITKERKE